MTWANYITVIHRGFPCITESNSRQTSPAAKEYNCIAWAYGKDDDWFEPDAEQQFSWPISRREYSLVAFEELFASIGYISCADASKEDGFLKIAIYVNGIGEPTHAARQLATGKWTSKLGKGIDIMHDSPDVLNGPSYGTAHVYMKRKTNP